MESAEYFPCVVPEATAIRKRVNAHARGLMIRIFIHLFRHYSQFPGSCREEGQGPGCRVEFLGSPLL
jgi:hypothetical protein